MPKEIFEYEQLEHAQKDLLLFSKMHAHENKPVYLLVSNEGEFRIEYKLEDYLLSAVILDIAINGVLFKRQPNIN